jgi:hypothetical protein
MKYELKNLKSATSTPPEPEPVVEERGVDPVSPIALEEIRTQADTADHRVNEAKGEVDRVRSEVEDLRKLLSDVQVASDGAHARELAESVSATMQSLRANG